MRVLQPPLVTEPRLAERRGLNLTATLVALGLVSVVSFLCLEALRLGAGFRDFDEGVYWLTLRALGHGNALYRTIFASEPPIFFYSLLPFAQLGHSLSAIRFGVLIFGAVGLVAAYTAGRFLAGPIAGWTAVVLVATSPLYFDQSSILQSDLPSLALALVAVALGLMGAVRRGRLALALAGASGFFLALAVGSKLSAVLVALPLLLILARAGPASLSSVICAVGGGVFGSLVVLLPIAGSLEAAYQQMIVSHTLGAQALPQSLSTNLSLLLVHRGLPLEAMAVLGVVVALWRRDQRIIVPVVWAGVTAVGILVYHPIFVHHLVQLVPPLALIAAVGFASLAGPASRSSTVNAAAFGLLALTTASGLFVAVRHTEADLQTGTWNARLASALDQLSKPGEFVISDNQYVIGLANRDIPPPVLDTSREVIAARLLTLPQLEAAVRRYHVHLVLIDGDRLRGIPGFSAWIEHDFVILETFGPQTMIVQMRPG